MMWGIIVNADAMEDGSAVASHANDCAEPLLKWRGPRVKVKASRLVLRVPRVLVFSSVFFSWFLTSIPKLCMVDGLPVPCLWAWFPRIVTGAWLMCQFLSCRTCKQKSMPSSNRRRQGLGRMIVWWPWINHDQLKVTSMRIPVQFLNLGVSVYLFGSP